MNRRIMCVFSFNNVHSKAPLLLIAVLLLMLLNGTAFPQTIESDYPKSFTVEVLNPLAQSRNEVMVYIAEESIKKIVPSFNNHAFVVTIEGKEIPAQYNHKDKTYPGIVLVVDKMEANDKISLTVRFKEAGKAMRAYPKRAQAELSHKVGGRFEDRKYIGGQFQNIDSLRVPEAHTDHSYYIRYEGPGWESDKVGYRYYLDWRNATDVFGKKTSEMVLQQVGQDGFDSYHEMQPWGMDILKVGESLGVGTLGFIENGAVRRVDKTDSTIAVVSENGDVYASITTCYYGWKVADTLDLKSHLSIHGGSRLTRHNITVSGVPANLCTGIGKDETAKLITSKGGKGKWGYLATYGNQSLNKDAVGLAVFFSPDDFDGFATDKHSHVVKFDPSREELDYYFMAGWELEPDGISNEQEFMEYLKTTSRELANPVQVKIVADKI